MLTCTAMPTLVVVVVNEYEGVLVGCHAPAGVVDVPEVSKVVDAPGYLLRVSELSDPSCQTRR